VVLRLGLELHPAGRVPQEVHHAVAQAVQELPQAAPEGPRLEA
jgi:hypothetical protein